jgi:hypothetical protein
MPPKKKGNAFVQPPTSAQTAKIGQLDAEFKDLLLSNKMLKKEVNKSRQDQALTKKQALALLPRSIAAKGLTRDGALWLAAYLNPFSDCTHALAGYPDASGARTLIIPVTEYLTLTSANAWDALVLMHPFFQAITGTGDYLENGSVDTQNQLVVAPTSTYPMFGLSASVINSGSAQLIFTNGTGENWQSIAPTTLAQQQPLRVIAKGFEIHNVSSAVTDGGLITTFRQEAAPELVDIDYPSHQPGSFTPYKQYVGYPTTAANALLLSGSQQWAANEGVYSVCTRPGSDSPIRCSTNFAPMIRQTMLATSPVYVGPVDGSTGHCTGQFYHDGYSLSGAFLTGMSAGSSVTVTARWLIEIAPSFDNQALAAIASPPAEFDPLALEIAARVSRTLPAGVKVGMNASGDFWRNVLNIIGDVAPAAASFMAAMPGLEPLAPIVSGIGSAAQIGAQFIPSTVSQPKAQFNSSVPRARLARGY